MSYLGTVSYVKHISFEQCVEVIFVFEHTKTTFYTYLVVQMFVKNN